MGIPLGLGEKPEGGQVLLASTAYLEALVLSLSLQASSGFSEK